MVKLSQTYGDLLLDLKDGCDSVTPPDTNYSGYVLEWIKKRIFHDQVLSDEDVSVIEKFTNNFKKQSRKIWKDNNCTVHYGRSVSLDTWLAKYIPIYYTCNCSECIEKPEKMEIDEKDQKTEEPNGQSKSYSVSFCTF